MEGLENYAKALVGDNLKKDEAQRTSCCIAVAGGGGSSISSLASTSGASQMLLDGDITYSRKSYLSYVGLPSDTTGFYYTSLNAAKLASKAALHRAFRFQTGDIRRMPGCIGVGCTSALTSSSGEEESHAYIVATKADGMQLALNITLEDRDKTRLEEEICVSYWILRAIDLIQKGPISEDDVIGVAEGISVEAAWSHVDQNQDEGIAAAKRILDGNEAVVVLVPVYDKGRPVSFQALDVPILPNDSLVFPGSYNPPHNGHMALAQAALRTANQRKRCSRSDNRSIFMEISIANADKPSIDPETVAKRLRHFLTLESLPSHWGVILTRAPLFSEKLSILQNCIDTFDGSTPNLSFVIGTDTLVRIIDPKYYNNDKSEMEYALCSMKGVNFLIGGRLEQKGDAEEPRFVSGSEEIKDLPELLKNMFTIIKEDEFRFDISSTEIRKELAAKAAATGPTHSS
jgi:nicotinic acid mononucleotide adenylyltransferase/nicotinamide mononucleotide (NMN) deamidase PncC